MSFTTDPSQLNDHLVSLRGYRLGIFMPTFLAHLLKPNIELLDRILKDNFEGAKSTPNFLSLMKVVGHAA